MHKLANLNLIRNWVGQSTNEDFYELCDKYGILVWDEFFQPNPSDGPDPTDLDTYMANVRDKILRYRNHPAIMLWCARNEGFPPKEIDDRLRVLMAELEPTRRYQPSSTSGGGVRSNGPYHWRTPREYYKIGDDFFKTETGSMSIPTLESVRGMLDKKDWETITDAWAEHDFANGAVQGGKYPGLVAGRYGKISNLADFVRKSQLMNYEAYRSMYEGRNAELFHPTTAIITWMSHPAQPSFVWQLYHYDYEPNSSLFAVQKAGEPQHIQLNEGTGPNAGQVQVINNLPDPLSQATAHATVYNLDGRVAWERDWPVEVPPATAANLGVLDLSSASNINFIKLDLKDASGNLISTNFYWHNTRTPDVVEASPSREPLNDDLTDLNKLPTVTLDPTISRHDETGKDGVGTAHFTVTLRNPSTSIALMAHIQLRRKSGDRVLPVFYSNNYVSLTPGESRTIEIEADLKDLHGEEALIVLDGWNTSVSKTSSKGVSIAPNFAADPANSPITNLPFQTEGLR
jgi:hypothetical protein